MPAVAKPAVQPFVDEIDLRREAEQRGHFEPIGRLLYTKTAHGNMLWPVEDGECVGPDFAVGSDIFLLLGPWLPLPPIRVASSKPCPKCLHTCDICGGEKIKQCEQAGCGGRGQVAIDGQLACDAPGCSSETGAINPDGCAKCHNTGALPRYDHCKMCDGTGKMTCPRCRGRGKISTGKVRGSIDWKADDCAACHGSGWKGAFKPQDVEKFRNAEVSLPAPGKPNGTKQIFWALGPIYEFGVEDSNSRQTRIFDVTQDSVGDFLMLLIPAGHKRQAIPKAKAYLVGGVVRERVVQGVA